MEQVTTEKIRATIEQLTGQQAPLSGAIPDTVAALLSDGGTGLGYSQFNELLILLGFDRVSPGFFQYLVDGETDYVTGASISSFESLCLGVTRFCQTALLLYGNVKYAFKTLIEADVLARDVVRLAQVSTDEFTRRHDEILPIERIKGEDTYYLGYLIERELRRRLDDPADTEAREQEQLRQEIVARGKRNHEAYLVSDHLDVYIATSMRERHDFTSVSRLVREIFENDQLRGLKLRWFDPTQAYCKNRVDKGLAEALMLRRAYCTIYFAQETDTLGKDSELASTLAQGKPVIAYVPEVDDNFANRLVADAVASHPTSSEADVILKQLQLFEPAAAWREPQVREWIAAPSAIPRSEVIARLQAKIKEHYDKRAQTLQESHPLGIQVNLATGVANGVLVVRNSDQCAKVVRGIVTRTLEFDLRDEDGMVVLREKTSGCIFRVMTGDPMLTNSFWNFYLEPA